MGESSLEQKRERAKEKYNKVVDGNIKKIKEVQLINVNR